MQLLLLICCIITGVMISCFVDDREDGTLLLLMVCLCVGIARVL